MSKSKPIAEGTVIMAEDQFAGRGQVNNIWSSEPGKNLTFSFLLYPTFLTARKQFLLNIAISIAINEVLTGIIGYGCKIKWPNDIFYHDSKLGGILIENTIGGKHLKSSVIGIGMNVNQINFPEPASRASSLKQITKRSINRRNLLEKILNAVELRYSELKNGKYDHHYARYTSNLYRFNELHTFVTEGTRQRGLITGISEEGRLMLNIEGKTYYYGLKEVAYVV